MSEDAATWASAKAGAISSAEEWFDGLDDKESADEGDADEAAHEYADGCSDVIYTYFARSIWANSSEVQTWEDEVEGYMIGSPEAASIDRRITICVYFAVRDAFYKRACELIDNYDDEADA
jgi:hypothetical protein